MFPSLLPVESTTLSSLEDNGSHSPFLLLQIPDDSLLVKLANGWLGSTTTEVPLFGDILAVKTVEDNPDFVDLWFEFDISPTGLSSKQLDVEPSSLENLVELSEDEEDAGSLIQYVRISIAELKTALMVSQSTEAGFCFMLASSEHFFKKGKSYSINSKKFAAAIFHPEQNDELIEEELYSIIADWENSSLLGPTKISLPAADLHQSRSEVIDILTRLARGDQHGLVQAYSYINKYDYLNKATPKELSEDIELQKIALLRVTLTLLLQHTHPVAISSLLSKQEDSTDSYVSEVQQFENMLQKSGLEQKDFTPFDARIPLDFENASTVEQIQYLSLPLSSLPPSMSKLAVTYEQNKTLKSLWQRQEEASVEEDILGTISQSIKSGDDFAASFLIIALRLARMEQFYIDGEPFNMMAFFLNTLSFANEYPAWGTNIALELLSKQNSVPFCNIFAASLSQISRPDVATNSIFGILLHQIGHRLVKEGWELEGLKLLLKEEPLIVDYIDYLSNEIAMLDGGPVSGENGCAVSMAIYKFFSSSPDKDALTKQAGEALLQIAELNSLKHTEYTHNSVEQKTEVAQYLGSLFNVIE